MPQNPWTKMLEVGEEQPPMDQLMFPPAEPVNPGYADSQGFSAKEIMSLKNIHNKEIEGIDAQKEGMKNLTAYRDREAAREIQPDYTALMMASDAWNKTKFLQSYQKPQTDQDRSKTVVEADLMKQKALGNMTDDEIAALKTQFYGEQVLKQGNSQSQKQVKANMLPGQIKADEEFGKGYAEFLPGGGYADTQKGLEQLKEVQTDLGKTDMATGPAIGLLPKPIRDVFLPKSSELQERVEEVVQRNLRQVLGAQFTEKEGTRLIQRAYNPRLPEAENQKRVGRLIEQISKAAAAKMDAAKYFQEHGGTLQGWNGRLLKSASELEDLAGLSDSKEKDPSSEKEEIYQKFPHLRPK